MQLPTGWSEDDGDLRGRWTGPPFDVPANRQDIVGVIRGSRDGRRCWAFRVPLSGGHGAHTVVVAVDAGREVPAVSAVPRPVVGRLARPLLDRLLPDAPQGEARRRIDRIRGTPVGDDEFHRRFHVRADDREAAERMLTPHVRATLLELGRLPLAFERREVLAWTTGPFSLEKVERLLALVSSAVPDDGRDAAPS